MPHCLPPSHQSSLRTGPTYLLVSESVQAATADMSDISEVPAPQGSSKQSAKVDHHPIDKNKKQ